MPNPGLPNNTHAASGPYPGYGLQAPSMPHSSSHSGMSGATQIPAGRQRTQNESDDEGHPESHDGDVRAKGPPSRSYSSGGSRTGRSSRRQTVAPPVREPQLPTFPCRHPECIALVTSDVSARLGGFCSNTHMWMAIHDGIATQCSRCKQRVCLEGWKYCSAECANRRH
ncbi:hypothetical protein BJY52DRAFT_936078 [Lactarius psammicola]|nr:hypothetical protein BJY52DRAFT_936078 [Lactarius psammicola]